MFFNSRFYYPVFTVLFLDFGLTLAQFSLLNAVWAATIVVAEVPSGALADCIGRKRLLVSAALIMAVEIGVIAFIPETRPSVVFGAFLVNRVLSGLAEAAASGADEALAYDSLAQQGLSAHWGRVLEVLMAFQAMGFIIAMTVGAMVYDPVLVSRVCGFLGFDGSIAQETTMRFPLYLTLITAGLTIVASLNMTESDAGPKPAVHGNKGPARSLTLKAGLWIIRTPFVLTVMLFGMLFDGVIRMVITLSSQYYRVIGLPESLFGVMGALTAVLGLVIPKLARIIAETYRPAHALGITFSVALAGLWAMNFFWPHLGAVPALAVFSAMYFNGFFISFYINQMASSDQRATVLSFKGLACNVFYGTLGLAYAALVKAKRLGLDLSDPENQIFMDTFCWFPVTLVAGFLILMLICFIQLRRDARDQGL